MDGVFFFQVPVWILRLWLCVTVLPQEGSLILSHCLTVEFRLKLVMRILCIVLWCIVLFKESSDFLSSTMKLSRLVRVGDLNVHIDDDSDLIVRGFKSWIIFIQPSMRMEAHMTKGMLKTLFLLWV